MPWLKGGSWRLCPHSCIRLSTYCRAVPGTSVRVMGEADGYIAHSTTTQGVMGKLWSGSTEKLPDSTIESRIGKQPNHLPSPPKDHRRQKPSVLEQFLSLLDLIHQETGQRASFICPRSQSVIDRTVIIHILQMREVAQRGEVACLGSQNKQEVQLAENQGCRLTTACPGSGLPTAAPDARGRLAVVPILVSLAELHLQHRANFSTEQSRRGTRGPQKCFHFSSF